MVKYFLESRVQDKLYYYSSSNALWNFLPIFVPKLKKEKFCSKPNKFIMYAISLNKASYGIVIIL